MSGKGCVSAGHSATAEAAQIILQEGGNAFDAALAALCASCVAEPVLSSLGGGGFLLARKASQAPVLYDFFSQIPKVRRPKDEVDFFPILADFGEAQQEFHAGKASIATPGVAKGVFEVHADLGSMPLSEIVQPATKLAREGVRVNRFQAYIFEIVGGIYKSNETCRKIYQSQKNPGELVGEGDLFALPDFANTLEALAQEGADLFYQGEIARKLSDDCAANGGHLTLADMEAYQVERRIPLAVSYGGAEIYTNPPPSTGGLLIAFALEILKKAELDKTSFGSQEHLERLSAAMALTNKARIDSNLHEQDGGEAANALLDPAFLSLYAAQVKGRPEALRGTTHISVIDAEGNAASLTVSNGEGAAYMVPGTGVMMNNMLGEEDINPHGFNQWPEDTRMCSMMSPSLVFQDKGEIIALGSGGSNRIRTAILQVLLNHLDFGLNLEESVIAPRLHFERGLLNAETGFAEDALSTAKEAVADFKLWGDKNLFFGGVHSVAFDTNSKRFSGIGDPRRGGVSLSA
ncbi:MAG: gamma-glutamyltransferase [Alphaproteobacteria bacterium]|nr:gamma-glutamyltransferase [Alphaproteobacteria bacterium]